MTGQVIRVVSINIWDLPVHLPGNDGHSRRKRLLEALPSLGADLVLVQEAFRPAFRGLLTAAMDGYCMAPRHNAARRVACLRMDRSGGLLTFSRWDISDIRFQPWRTPPRMRFDERIGGKGCLWTRLATPVGPLVVGNAHLYAGNSARDARARRAQVHEMLVRGALDEESPTLLMGDFNMAVELEASHRGRTGFDLMSRAGFHEIARGRTGEIATMTPHKNRYAAMIQRVRRDRRLTQVFLRGLSAGPNGATVCLDDPPVSDHFGLLAELRIPA